jgi:hypothetical protein
MFLASPAPSTIVVVSLSIVTSLAQAQALSSTLFDAVGAEATRTVAGSIKDALENVLRMRDPVTASLTRGDPRALALLEDAESVIRSTLGFSHPTTP